MANEQLALYDVPPAPPKQKHLQRWMEGMRMDELREMAVLQHLQHMNADFRRTGLFPSLCVLLDEACEIILQKQDYTKVVRCKDCKSYVNRECKNLVRHMTNPCSIFTLPNDFCSYGERREGE